MNSKSIFIVFIFTIIIVCYLYFRSPFNYPYFDYHFDVSRKRKPKIADLLDKYMIQYGFDRFQQHYNYVEAWKEQCLHRISKSIFKKLRKRQFEACIDDKNMFHFVLIRQKTKYKQVNYCKTSYKVEMIDKEYYYDFNYLSARYKKLQSIDFECTLNEYNSKNQRKLMTKKLRKQIMKQDHYTCQLCGKYMPDEVGLHIDHIIPISKGGKTVPSNLQVLCSKCNGRKSNK